MAKRSDTHVVTDLAQLKALSSELRQTLLGAFCGEPTTTKQVAEALGQPPTKLYRHVAMLEAAGLLRLVAKRQKRGTTEKYYQAVARSFEIGDEVLGESRSEVEKSVTDSFREALTHVRRAVSSKEDSPRAMVIGGQVCLSPKDVTKLQKDIEALLKRHSKKGSVSRRIYSVLVAVYDKQNSA